MTAQSIPFSPSDHGRTGTTPALDFGSLALQSQATSSGLSLDDGRRWLDGAQGNG